MDRLAGASATVVAALVAAATAAPAGAQVAPRLECGTVDVREQTITATWGHANTDKNEVEIPPGSQNFFKPAPSFQLQPTTFAPGISRDVFQTTFYLGDTSTSTWVIRGIGETASLDTRSCFRLNDPPERRAQASIIGSPIVGRRLALDAGVVAGEVQQIDVQWQRDEPAGTDAWVDIPGADTVSYVPASPDAGHRLRVRLLARSVGSVASGGPATDGSSTALTDPTAAVEPEPVPPVPGTPTITGTPQPGQTLTADPGTWTGASSFAYDWQRCTAAGCTSTGTGGTTYALTGADLGKRMRVVVTPDGATQPTGISVETDTVATPPAASPLTVTPSSLDFLSIRLGRAGLRRLTIKNTGASSIAIGGIARIGSAAADFTPLSTCSFVSRLGPGRSCTVMVAFKPGGVGTRTAQLRVIDGNGGGPAPVAMKGTGLPR